MLTIWHCWEQKGLKVNMGKTKVMNCKVRQGQAENSGKFPCGICKNGVEETRYVAQNARSGFTKSVVGFEVDWKLQLAFNALSALND